MNMSKKKQNKLPAVVTCAVASMGDKTDRGVMTTANEYDVDEGNAELLKSWLDAGKWSREQATLLFLDIDPDRAYGECFATFSGHGSIQYDYFDDDDTNSRILTGHDCDGDEVYLTTEQDTLLSKTKILRKKIERKINQVGEAGPQEWIDLALEKDIHIPWLDWAVKNNLYNAGKKTIIANRTAASASKPMLGTGKGDEEAGNDEPLPTANWILLVRAEATKRWRMLSKAGASPTKFSIMDDLVRWCGEEKIKTGTGIAVSGENLYKFALRPWTPPDD